MRVKNLNGTGDRKCKCGTWILHFNKFSKRNLDWVSKCSVMGCNADATDGGHVKFLAGTDESQYIVPLCKRHNLDFGAEFDIKAGVDRVSANVSETCGKSRPIKLSDLFKEGK